MKRFEMKKHGKTEQPERKGICLLLETGMLMAVLLGSVYALGKTASPFGEDGAYGFDGSAHVFRAEEPVAADQLTKLLELDQVLVFSVQGSAARIYDPDQLLLRRGEHLETLQSRYFRMADYRGGARISIPVYPEVSHAPHSDRASFISSALAEEGVQELANLFEGGIGKGEKVYVQALSPDCEQAAVSLFSGLKLHQESPRMTNRSLLSVLGSSAGHFHTRVILMACFGFAGFAWLALWLLEDGLRKKQAMRFFMQDAAAILSAAGCLWVMGFQAAAFHYALQIGLLIAALQALLILAERKCPEIWTKQSLLRTALIGQGCVLGLFLTACAEFGASMAESAAQFSFGQLMFPVGIAVLAAGMLTLAAAAVRLERKECLLHQQPWAFRFLPGSMMMSVTLLLAGYALLHHLLTAAAFFACALLGIVRIASGNPLTDTAAD